MAPTIESRNATPAPRLDDLDNYFLDGDLDDDPFAPTKRKEPGDGLGLDEEVSVAKKARVPRIKLDQDRLVHHRISYSLQSLMLVPGSFHKRAYQHYENERRT